MKQSKENTSLALDANMLELLKAYRLDEVLDSISRKCLTHAKDLLNQEKSEDQNGNRIKVLIEFNERIQHLVRSARRKNKNAPQESREWRAYEKVTSKERKVYKRDDDEIE